ncbi:ATP-grasp domain-containing protein [Paenibacillus glycinis]|uniref:ATP-grasp domain-containing protein n=1 Tax=Paenibacillus glycinis TaxID=2697035 RepID=A0ABW9XXF3_9BACL|nr:ATP-grasp domain-containing protein [Paenibacillus glycinis]NBD27201.1 ATP-grasp domain-containing protein [Paenibacillus glycinis]
MKKVKWILQHNLINEDLLKQLTESILSNDGIVEEIRIIPFSDEMSFAGDIQDEDIIVLYGSTTLLLNAYKNEKLRRGLFFNPSSFQMDNYNQYWKEHMLNFDSAILSPDELMETTKYDDGNYFIHPNEDTKLFTGGVMNIKEFKNDLQKEKVVSASRYVMNGELSVDETDIPHDLISFIEERFEEYTPHDIFVMDIALVNDEYKIIECNCFNGTGFYNHNIDKIIKEINNFLLSR